MPWKAHHHWAGDLGESAELPDGQLLADAIAEVDTATGGGPLYDMGYCAHPVHFGPAPADGDWRRRIKGLRANASRRSHAELDEAPDLDAGNPAEPGAEYAELHRRMPWITTFGGCCGCDLAHVAAIAGALGKAA